MITTKNKKEASGTHSPACHWGTSCSQSDTTGLIPAVELTVLSYMKTGLPVDGRKRLHATNQKRLKSKLEGPKPIIAFSLKDWEQTIGNLSYYKRCPGLHWYLKAWHLSVQSIIENSFQIVVNALTNTHKFTGRYVCYTAMTLQSKR
jgi:hypothetical protein